VEVDGDWKFIQVGNERLLDTNGGDVSTDSDVEETINKFVERNESSVILFVCIEDELEMALALSDDVRPETRDAVMALRDIGVDITMLTGDSADVAVVIGEKVQIPASSIHARLMPSEKLDWVKAMESEGKRVAMIGDGINDAAALAGATIGMAMGAGGTAMAASAADLVIMSDNLLRVAQTLTLCRKARAIILQNCVGTVLFKLATLGAAVFGYVPLWAAVLVDVGTLVLVVVNGIRVLDLKRCGCRDDYYSDPEEGGDGSGATLKPIRQAINNPMITGITGGGTHTYDRVINSDAGAVIQGGDMTGDDRL
jgi:Cd2+/Zn2+-exporting ATPase